jgi:hypothetical protein
MNKIKFIVSITILFIILISVLAQRELFIKQIDFKLDRISDIDYENEYFLTMKLNKGSLYKFKIINHIDGYPGEAVVELLDADNLVLTNVLAEKYFEAVQFQCNKTAFYDILIKFRNKKTGNSQIEIYMVQ